MTRPTIRRIWPLLPLFAILLLILLWDWNWFKPLAERQASAALGRTVHIDDLHVALSWHPEVTISGIKVENPEGFLADAAPLATVKQLALRFGLRDLFDRRVQISKLEIDGPEASLRDDAKGVRNWQLTLPASDPDAKPWDVRIEGLNIRDGRFAFVDAALKADVKGTLHTGTAAAGAEAPLQVVAEGRYDSQAFKARFTGGSALSLRSPENPYPVDLAIDSGQSSVTLKGSLLDPLQFAGAKLRLMLKGRNLSELATLLHLPLPNTPPYQLEGNLDYQAKRILFNDFKGLLGESDLAGDISVRLQQPRPLLEATVRSKQVRLADLAGLIGGNPNEPAAARTDGRVLPSSPISVPRLQTADVRFSFTGDSIQGDDLPFDRLAFKLTLDDGLLRFSPADIGIGAGALRLYATLDPRGDTLGLEAKADLRNVDIARLLEKSSYKGTGRIGGMAALSGKGRSVAELLGGGDGELKLAMVGGDFSALLLDLAGFDFGNATLSLLGVTPRTEVHCLVGDFELKKGVLGTRAFVLDTGNTNLLLDGGANFKDETLDLRLRTQPKRANIGRLKAPIYIKGRFADPSIQPDYAQLGVRTAAAVALGALFTPLAALLPTLQLGPGEDRDCQALLAEADTQAPPQPK